MRKDTKKIIITILIIVSVFTIFFVSRININKKEDKIPEVKLQEKDKANKALAIMVSEDGEKYKEYKEEKLPGNEYKFKEAKCIDKNGNSIDGKVVEQEGKITIKTNKTIYCTFYYDHKGITEILRENDTNKVISSNLVGDLYRYQGVGTKEAEDATHKLVNNNYICFGTSDKDACINNPKKYLFRIIGITTDEKLKLIKNANVIENNIGVFVWDNKDSIEKGSEAYTENCAIWPNSLIFKRLNGISNGKVSGEGKVADGGNTDIFVDNPNYDYLKSGDKINGGTTASTWYDIIDNHNWLYGNLAGDNDANGSYYGGKNNGLIVYQIETGNLPTARYDTSMNYKPYTWDVKNDVVDAKIGLMYLHDYYLSYDNNIDWFSNPATNKNWIYSSAGWFISSPGINWFGTSGNIYPWNTVTVPHNVLPVFYLKNNILISGMGTQESPYLINF